MNRYPIVLAHGIARFDFLTQSLLRRANLFIWDMSRAFDRLHYFKRIASTLQADGHRVYETDVNWAGPVETRAKDLRRQVEAALADSGAERAHIIGHSMGGLDARHMIVDEGMGDRVASLTTIGTPHLGTSFANWGLAHGGHEAIVALRQRLDLGGFLTLTATERAAFNERARHAEATNDVVYQTVASAQAGERVFGPIRFAWGIIFDQEGENDGLVPATSQAWTDRLVGDDGTAKSVPQRRFPFPADHLNQIGWWDLDELSRSRWWRLSVWREKERYEAAVRDIYRQIARDLAAL